LTCLWHQMFLALTWVPPPPFPPPPPSHHCCSKRATFPIGTRRFVEPAHDRRCNLQDCQPPFPHSCCS
jgi:hypothetical protein